MTMRCVTSSDIAQWSAPDRSTIQAAHGASLAVFRGELWGAWVSTQSGADYSQVFIAKFVNGKLPSSTPVYGQRKKLLAHGRVTVATNDDRFYVSYRGLSSQNPVLIWSETPENPNSWTVVKLGIPSLKFPYTPAIASYRGDIHMFNVSQQGEVYWQIVTSDGRITLPWTTNVIQKGYTTQAPAACIVYQNKLRLFLVQLDGRTPVEFNMTYWRGQDPKVSAEAVASIAPGAGPVTSNFVPSVAVHKDNLLYEAFTQAGDVLNWGVMQGDKWLSWGQKPSSVVAYGQLGCASFNGKMYVTYIEKPAGYVYSAEEWGEGIILENTEEEEEEGQDTDADSVNDLYYEKKATQKATIAQASARVSHKSVQPRKRWYQRLLCQ